MTKTNFTFICHQKGIQMENENFICPECHQAGARFVCSKCNVVRYCGKDCQKKHWIHHHKKYCGVEQFLVKEEAYSNKPILVNPMLFYIICYIDGEQQTAKYSKLLEDTFYSPNSLRNQLFMLQFRQHKTKLYAVISIPIDDTPNAYTAAQTLSFGLQLGRPANDFPMTLQNTDNVAMLVIGQKKTEKIKYSLFNYIILNKTFSVPREVAESDLRYMCV